MTKQNAIKKMNQLGTVEYGVVNFKVSLDNYDLICDCNSGDDGAVHGFIIERPRDKFQWFKPNFKQAVSFVEDRNIGIECGFVRD